MDLNIPYKTHAGYKLYTPDEEKLYLFAHTSEPVEMEITDNAIAFYISLVATVMTILLF